MRKKAFLIIAVLTCAAMTAQEPAFSDGEWFKFRLHYGLLNAGYADLTVSNDTYKGAPVYHVKGYGYTVSPTKWFFEVEDNYETYVDKESGLPYKFVRKIDEGGHTKNKVVDFDQQVQKAYVSDKKHRRDTVVKTEPSVHDMVSSFYFLRNKINRERLKKGDEIVLNMFFDEENFKFKMRFMGKEAIRTKFGKVNALIFRPYVQAGRVFKEKESLTVWISDDKNKIPLRVKAELAVGSLKADLEAYKGLSHPFYIIQD